MTEFVGRTGALRVYSYPETPRAVNPLTAFARNFATGPKISTSIGPSGIQIPWNAVDGPPTRFTIAAGGVTVSIAGDVTGSFNNGDGVRVTPLVPAVGPVVPLTIANPPVFAAGFTTFDLSAPIDGTTTAGSIEDATVVATDVPITPRATGVVLISGVVVVENASGGPVSVQLTVQVGGVAMTPPLFNIATIPDGSFEPVPFLAEVDLPIGVTSNIEIFVDGDGASLAQDSSSINIQEVSVATG